jgi:hypothetical protein
MFAAGPDVVPETMEDHIQLVNTFISFGPFISMSFQIRKAAGLPDINQLNPGIAFQIPH